MLQLLLTPLLVPPKDAHVRWCVVVDAGCHFLKQRERSDVAL